MTKLKAVLAAVAFIAGSLLVGNNPAQASVPDWDKAPTKITWEGVPTSAQMAQIEANGKPIYGQGWSFQPAQARVNMPESPVAAAKRAASDCANLGGFFFCTWVDANYGGSRWAWSEQTISSWWNHGISFASSPEPNGINNRGSAWVNNTTHAMNLFDSISCDFSYWNRQMQVGQQASGGGSDWNDRVSAIRWAGSAQVAC